jgi:hypothetical protein
VTQPGVLAALQLEWGHAYVIGWQAGQYFACRRDNGAICRRGDAEDLRQELDADNLACPVMIW